MLVSDGGSSGGGFDLGQLLGNDITNLVNDLGAQSALGGDKATAGHFQVDLPTLHRYYGDVYQVWSKLDARIGTLQQSPYANACFDFGEITGVANSMNATVNGAVGPDSSMLGALMNAREALAKHLGAVKDVYLQYIAADDQHASELNQAMNGSASQYGFGSSGNVNEPVSTKDHSAN